MTTQILGHADVQPRNNSLKREWVRALLVVGAVLADAAAIFVATLSAAMVRYDDLEQSHIAEFFLIFTPIYILSNIALHGYNLRNLESFGKSSFNAISSLFIAASFSFAAAYALKAGDQFSRLEAGFAISFAFFYVGIVRASGAVVMKRLESVIAARTIILHDDDSVVPPGGASAIDVRNKDWDNATADPLKLDEIYGELSKGDRVVLMFREAESRIAWGRLVRMIGIDGELYSPELAAVQPLGLDDLHGVPTLVISRGPLTLGERLLKRGFDIAVVLLLAPVVVPVVAVLMVLIRFESPGSPLFRQPRVGRNNAIYHCCKLRSMRAETLDHGGARSTTPDDDRITRIGRFIRATSLDELPQLWNVLKGEMSLVGPRPHALGSTAEGELFWDVVPNYWSRHAMKPGVTGLAQVRGLRGSTRSRADIEARVAADLEYINAWSIWRDIAILFMTARVLMHRNAF